MKDPSHPIWSLLRLLIMMLALIVVLWMNAEKFDKTEVQTIITMFLIGAGAEGVTQYLRGFGKSDGK